MIFVIDIYTNNLKSLYSSLLKAQRYKYFLIITKKNIYYLQYKTTEKSSYKEKNILSKRLLDKYLGSECKSSL